MTEYVVGDRWGYRARQRDPLAEVEVLAVGTKRPPRVHVSFIDESFEGKEAWVPPARLKAPWNKAATWLAHEARWLAVVEASDDFVDSPFEGAVELVFSQIGNSDVVRL